jgi:DNA-binding LytR/AlgR family response regulator
MSDPNAKDTAAQAKKLTTADAAKQVRRTVIEYVDGKNPDGTPGKIPKSKQVSVQPSEVLTFAEYETHVVVVTKDGQKLSSLDA